MTHTEYLQAWTGHVRCWDNGTDIQVDRAYPHILTALGQSIPPPLDDGQIYLPPQSTTGHGIPIYSAGLHHGEEPELPLPVGAIFCRRCAVQCRFCLDKAEVNAAGLSYSIPEVARLMNALVAAGARAIDLVNPDVYTADFRLVLEQAQLSVPIIWNTHGYRMRLVDSVDIYLIDVKFTDAVGARLTSRTDYLTQCLQSIRTAYAAVGEPDQLPWQRGVCLRYLVMPGLTDDAEEVFRAVARISPSIPVHVMGQYIPATADLPQRGITRHEYERVLEHAQSAGLTRVSVDHAWTSEV